MDQNLLYKNYFQENTSGYKIITVYFNKYYDLFHHSGLTSAADVINEVFLSLSKTNFSKIEKIENYILRAIKIQRWSILDKSKKRKSIVLEKPDKESDASLLEQQVSDGENPQQNLTGMELLTEINLFKIHINSREADILNSLIADVPRTDMAKRFQDSQD